MGRLRHSKGIWFSRPNIWLRKSPKVGAPNCLNRVCNLAHQNRTIAIASDFRVDEAKSPEIPQNEGFWAQKLQLEIANRQRLSIAPLDRNATLFSLVSEIARFLGSAMGIAIANRKSRCDFRALRSVKSTTWTRTVWHMNCCWPSGDP